MVHWLIDGGRRSASGVLPTIKAELLTTGDFNDDGTTDVLWQNAAGAVSAWEMDGGKRIATLQLPSLNGMGTRGERRFQWRWNDRPDLAEQRSAAWANG